MPAGGHPSEGLLRLLKVQSQRELPGAITAGALGQRRFENAEGAGIADVGGRWRVVRVIKHVRERSFEAQTKPLVDLELLGQACIHINHSRTLQDAQTAIAKPAGTHGRRSKSINIEEIAGRLVGRDGIADAVWTGHCAATRANNHIGIGLIVDRADGRSEPLSRLDGGDGAEVPTFEERFPKARPGELERQLINAGQEDTLARGSDDVSAILAEVEAIGNLDGVGLFPPNVVGASLPCASLIFFAQV